MRTVGTVVPTLNVHEVLWSAAATERRRRSTPHGKPIMEKAESHFRLRLRLRQAKAAARQTDSNFFDGVLGDHALQNHYQSLPEWSLHLFEYFYCLG